MIKMHPSFKYFFNNYKLLFVLLIIVILISSIFEGLGIAAFFPIFLVLFGDTSSNPDGLMGALVRISSVFPSRNPIYQAFLLLLTVYLLKTALSIARITLTTYVEQKITYRSKSQVIDKYSKAQYQFFLDQKQGDLIYKMLSSPTAPGVIVTRLSQTAADLCKLLIILFILLSTFPYMAYLLVVTGVLYTLVIFRISKKVSLIIGQGQLKAGTEEAVVANEFLNGIRLIITSLNSSWWIQKFNSASYTLAKLRAQQVIFASIPRPIMELILIVFLLGFLLILWTSDQENFTNNLPHLGVIAIALAQVWPALISIGRSRMEMMALVPNVVATHDLISGSVPMRPTGDKKIKTFTNSIVFQNVTFGYPDRQNLLSNVNLQINQGESVALVGPSGGGKTTIINLILGIFESDSGTIKIDNIPLSELNHETWLGKIGLVSQEAFTFHSSIANNIQFGRDYSREQVIEAARISGAHEFITALPNGYETVVGERGMKLSGGQQQRLALARAILPDPSILIFDEATSSLDSISEHEVQDSIERISDGRTVITIAHRLSTITKSDNIMFISNGSIIEEGNHDTLFANRKHYYEMLNSQTDL